jgi:hypothetical protein
METAQRAYRQPIGPEYCPVMPRVCQLYNHVIRWGMPPKPVHFSAAFPTPVRVILGGLREMVNDFLQNNGSFFIGDVEVREG